MGPLLVSCVEELPARPVGEEVLLKKPPSFLVELDMQRQEQIPFPLPLNVAVTELVSLSNSCFN